VACASVAALAGTVAAVATAAGADGDQAERTEAAARDASRPPAPRPAADTAAAAPTVTTRPSSRPPSGPERVGAPLLGATVEVPAGWDPVPDQDLVPVPRDRFPTVVALPGRATVLVGRLDPARAFGPDSLADEARRLVGSFADGALRQAPGDGGRIADVSDDAGRLDGRDSHTVVRRVTAEGGDPGPLVRVTTVAGQRGEPGLVLLAVAAPGPRQNADAAAADRIVRSLSSAPPDAPPSSGRAAAPPASAAPGLPPRGAPASRAPVSARPRPASRAPVSAPPRPSSRAPVSPPARPAPPAPTDR
jgi:hypothetical protein